MCMKIMPGMELPASVASGCITRVPRVIAGVPPAMVAFAPWLQAAFVPLVASCESRLRPGINPRNPWLNLNPKNAPNYA